MFQYNRNLLHLTNWLIPPPTGNPWVYWNEGQGLISASFDGLLWYTLEDKNVGATTVWNGTIDISNQGPSYSDIQAVPTPPDGWHISTAWELQNIINWFFDWWWNGYWLMNYLKIPWLEDTGTWMGMRGHLNTSNNSPDPSLLDFNTLEYWAGWSSWYAFRNHNYSPSPVRYTKNVAILPTPSWTVLYQPSS
jgi:hypothetical protein